MQNKPFRAALLIAVLSPPAPYAQNVSGIVASALNVGAQDPLRFAQEIRGRPSWPKRKGRPCKSESPVKTAANDLLYLKEQSEPIVCAVLTISENGGVTAQVQDKPYAFPLRRLSALNSASLTSSGGADAFESGKDSAQNRIRTRP